MQFPLPDDYFDGQKNVTQGAGDPEGHLAKILNQLNARVYSNTTRPTSGNVIGMVIFNVDDGPNGAPNWWNGTNWVDANGNPT